MASSVLDFTVANSKGVGVPMRELLGGRVALIVNSASQCGLTPQYEGLQKLQDKFSARGFTVVAFHCNQFGGQEPGSQEQIEQMVCTCVFGAPARARTRALRARPHPQHPTPPARGRRFKGTFPIMKKVEVNGDGADPLWVFMKASKPGVSCAPPRKEVCAARATTRPHLTAHARPLTRNPNSAQPAGQNSFLASRGALSARAGAPL
jgi:glutathione peroxidase